MQMLSILEKYKQKGNFYFKIGDNLRNVCNAPTNSSGLYLIYANEIDKRIGQLIYIGISGRSDKNGGIIHRKNGLYGRFLTGKQFGARRQHSWTNQMTLEKIDCLRIEWYVTHGEFNSDLPREIEMELLRQFDPINHTLPRWNKKF